MGEVGVNFDWCINPSGTESNIYSFVLKSSFLLKLRNTSEREKDLYLLRSKNVLPEHKGNQSMLHHEYYSKLEKLGKESPSFYNIYYIPCSSTCCLSKTVTDMIYIYARKGDGKKYIYVLHSTSVSREIRLRNFKKVKICLCHAK